MPNTLSDMDWDLLLRRIASGRCTPFLGAGASYPALPLGSEIAQRWAESFGYPLASSRDLPKVAQFLAINRDPLFPHEELIKLIKSAAPPKFNESDEPHGLLAELPLSVYMTTNCDSFMVWALKGRYRDARRAPCKWNAATEGYPSVFDTEPGYQPTPANPLVFHLHGYDDLAESLVLTEDDYLDFLVSLSRQEELLPVPVKRALAVDSLLFIGYSLADWNLRVILRGLRIRSRMSIAVLLPPTETASDKAQEYMTRYYRQIEDMDLRIYWGTAREFTAELRQRWAVFRAPL